MFEHLRAYHSIERTSTKGKLMGRAAALCTRKSLQRSCTQVVSDYRFRTAYFRRQAPISTANVENTSAAGRNRCHCYTYALSFDFTDVTLAPTTVIEALLTMNERSLGFRMIKSHLSRLQQPYSNRSNPSFLFSARVASTSATYPCAKGHL